jgi:hypothetical protein
MGLDMYPSRSPHEIVLTLEDELSLAELDLRLCEWLGFGSFRGKVYLDVVDRVAGVCLTQDWISPREVAAIANAFEAHEVEEVVRACASDRYPVTAEEVRSLSRLFRACADLGLGLVGDY